MVEMTDVIILHTGKFTVDAFKSNYAYLSVSCRYFKTLITLYKKAHTLSDILVRGTMCAICKSG